MSRDSTNDLLARKAVRQSYSPSAEVLYLMRSFREMTNECIRIGLATGEGRDSKGQLGAVFSMRGSYGVLSAKDGSTGTLSPS